VMKFSVLIVAQACVLLSASVGQAQRYTVYGKPGFSGSYTRIGGWHSGNESGPPLYSGSTHSTAVATIQAAPVLAAVNATGYSYLSTGDFFYPASGHGNCITRLTDANSRINMSLATSWGGGGNDLMWSVDRSYGAIQSSGGGLTTFMRLMTRMGVCTTTRRF
jgi:hypothetical protein